MATIRGHMGQFKIFQDGALANIVNVTSVDVNQESSFMRSRFVGNPIPQGDQSIDGFSGTAEMEVSDAEADKFIDALITNNLNGIGVSDYSFQTIETYADGTQQAYVYFDVQFKLSRRNPASTEKITKRLEFQAAGRIPL